MVVASTKILAQKAARAVVVKYEDLSMILTIEEAIEAKSFHPQYDRSIRRGLPIDEAMASADIVLEGSTRMGGQGVSFFAEVRSEVLIEPCRALLLGDDERPRRAEARKRRDGGVCVDASSDGCSAMGLASHWCSSEPSRCSLQAIGRRLWREGDSKFTCTSPGCLV